MPIAAWSSIRTASTICSPSASSTRSPETTTGEGEMRSVAAAGRKVQASLRWATCREAFLPKGIKLNRSSKHYEKDAPSLFKRDAGYPAKRPWFPYALNGNYQEIIPSAAEGYPYPMKALFTYWNAMAVQYAGPAQDLRGLR